MDEEMEPEVSPHFHLDHCYAVPARVAAGGPAVPAPAAPVPGQPAPPAPPPPAPAPTPAPATWRSRPAVGSPENCKTL